MEMSSDDPTVPLTNQHISDHELIRILERRVRELEQVVARRGYDTRPIYEKHEAAITALQEELGKLKAALLPSEVSIESASDEKVESNPEQSKTTGLPLLREDPTVFFSQRVADAFPGLRGLQWLNDPEQAIERLDLLLRPPLTFRLSGGGYSSPIWWWRGDRTSQVETFEAVSKTKCVINIDELEIDKVAVYRSGSYYRQFVYVQAKPEQPVGIHKYDKDDFARQIELFGYQSEEYGLFGTTPISRAEYDDGAAVINGTVVQTAGASKLRVRYLSRYNLILAPHFTPINSNDLDERIKQILNGILADTSSLEELIKIVEAAPRHGNDR
jgi:hypothetical protein